MMSLIGLKQSLLFVEGKWNTGFTEGLGDFDRLAVLGSQNENLACFETLQLVFGAEFQA